MSIILTIYATLALMSIILTIYVTFAHFIKTNVNHPNYIWKNWANVTYIVRMIDISFYNATYIVRMIDINFYKMG
jgi:small-conductance mechanosensitive channel